MISLQERQKRIRIRDTNYTYQRFHERGLKLFGNIQPKDMLKECYEAIKDPTKSIFIEDKRKKDSTHYCIFISDAGGYVCIPCVIDDNYIIIITIKDIREDDQPFWYIRNYNEVADIRKLPKMNYIPK